LYRIRDVIIYIEVTPLGVTPLCPQDIKNGAARNEPKAQKRRISDRNGEARNTSLEDEIFFLPLSPCCVVR
jgi:hypothetical protein